MEVDMIVIDYGKVYYWDAYQLLKNLKLTNYMKTFLF